MYRLNHFIPRSILDHWVSNGGTTGQKYNGVWCYLIQEDKIIYSNSKGQKGFSFAIAEDLYVPIIEGMRNVHFEGKWLSGLESTFANFVRQLSEEEPDLKFDDLYEMTKLLMGFYSFKYRSKYDFDQVMAYLKENPNMLKDISQSKDIKVAAIENIVHATTETYLKNKNAELNITKYPGKDVIFGDRPLIEINPATGLSLFPTNPSTIIGINRQVERAPSPIVYRVVNGKISFADFFNKRMAENAYHWLIAFDQDTLKKYIPYCKRGERKGNIHFEPITELPYGWSLS
ncbi:DUF4238 domain-containing protein [Leptospira selangorensis]|uniref:DUF4238 domain-containing protein n=1 Tax=Leptospira selangorensis TaxID=2484982 RepID=A0A5F2C236_9LEPT|nr:DUF4238 domain-containing protein [Leptospira selangorensis]TGM12974.1 DUF4238 domain-containing protein [Leptospira selangorensis]TGM21275.1 DUF4238 domain-containing protein [Leptospira selangorensis]